MRRAVATATDRRQVVEPGERVVIGCSGGPDSTALLDALHHLAPPRRWELHVAHVDHGLRAESVAEQRLVAAMAARLGLPFHPRRVSVAPGASLQERARDARRAALLEVAGFIGATAIALGHTSDDQAETVLMRVMTRATPAGIAAMQERAGPLARPLLRVWREQTIGYCDCLGLEVADDPSNSDLRFLRARIRHQVLPALEAVFPSARRRLVTLALRQQRLLQTAGAQRGPW